MHTTPVREMNLVNLYHISAYLLAYKSTTFEEYYIDHVEELMKVLHHWKDN